MQTSIIKIDGLETEEAQHKLHQHLSEMTGVSAVQVDMDSNEIRISYETPVNLNNLEKEIYDAGYQILN
ncbi:putative copper chaperone CsoZ [Staphylococcus debuckii]|uniref:Heavy metal-associated domain-containing protein n=2 Tax=Staphylococcus debuckii TaxID=2044912 RepID=A0ABU9F1P4_9STAP|nr:heavy-metal-associated domain-containing protein [Staphylococcus debuckii]